jgi:hypothetical protein
MQTYEEHFDASVELRNAYWNAAGTMETDVLAPLINPAFRGGPRWPSLRQAFATIHLPGRTIMATDGLSDPYDDMDTNADNAPYNGFGMEVYISSHVIEEPKGNSWQFQLLQQAAGLVAERGNLVSFLESYTYISTEFADIDVPEEWRNEQGMAGAILGLPDETLPGSVQLSIESVKMVSIKLLTRAELKYVVENGAEARMKLAELLIKQGNATLSSLSRPSVI